MIFKLLKAEGLAQNTYFIGSGDEAVVIDPRREPGDIDDILQLARENCMAIRHILETHRNEDFVHGSQELASLTGAAVHHGGRLPFKYGEPLKDRDEISFGSLKIMALETQGHTPESLTYALYDNKHRDIALAVFTGDTLFVGSTGRVDLAPGDKAENARLLYESLHGKILPLGDQVLLCPAHGAGSVCGSGMGDRDWSTIGYEKLTNPHLQLNKDEFIRLKVNEQLTRPPYFDAMERYNLDGPPSLQNRGQIKALQLSAFKAAADSGAEIIDARMPQAFGGGHIPGSYSIWLGGTPIYPGWLLGHDKKILLVADPDSDAQIADKFLCRIGYDQVIGYLCGGFEVWQNAGLSIEFTGEMPVEALKPLMDTGDIRLIDVREPHEWQGGIVPGAILKPVGLLKGSIPDIPRDRPVAVMCSVGRRGALGASILQKAGFTMAYNVPGGFTAWRKKGYPVKPYSS